MKPIQIIIIDDDPEMETRPLYEELVETYGKTSVIWKEDAVAGLHYIQNNLTKRTVVILDYDFGSKKENGLKVFNMIQKESRLLYIILNTAKSIADIPAHELKSFINNHLMALVDKTDGYEKTLEEVGNAIQFLNSRLDCILEEWILRHEFFTREKPYLKDKTGKTYSLNYILEEIRKDSQFGRSISMDIIDMAISMVQADIDKLENTK